MNQSTSHCSVSSFSTLISYSPTDMTSKHPWNRFAGHLTKLSKRIKHFTGELQIGRLKVCTRLSGFARSWTYTNQSAHKTSTTCWNGSRTNSSINPYFRSISLVWWVGAHCAGGSLQENTWTEMTRNSWQDWPMSIKLQNKTCSTSTTFPMLRSKLKPNCKSYKSWQKKNWIVPCPN